MKSGAKVVLFGEICKKNRVFFVFWSKMPQNGPKKIKKKTGAFLISLKLSKIMEN